MRRLPQLAPPQLTQIIAQLGAVLADYRQEEMNIDRVDFTDAEACHFCHRPLPLGIAHLVRMDDLSEVPAGPACARKQAPTAEFPNFTKSAHYAEDQVEPRGGERREGRTEPTDETRRAESARMRAITYLRLRQEKMTAFAGVRYDALVPLYKRYGDGALTDDDVTYLENLMAAVERRRPLLSLVALQTAYAYHVLLRRSAEKIRAQENREYLYSLDAYLCRNLRLTTALIVGANRWLEHLSQVRLRPCAHW